MIEKDGSPVWKAKMPEWRKAILAELDSKYVSKVEREPICYKTSRRMTDTAGRYVAASILATGGMHWIILSAWMSEKEAHETFIHEFCHMLAWCCHGTLDHDDTWQKFMVLLNRRPEEYHQINLCGRAVVNRVMKKLGRSDN
jgi:predicted SprT family Zn-dependent metalloprotease